MDKLRRIIGTLTSEEQKELHSFVQRQRKKKSRKDIQLLRLVQQDKELSGKELVQKLYPDDKNTVAYHALRKRLTRHVSEFIMLKRTSQDPTEASQIMGLISLATHLFNRSEEQLGWEQIRKAEKIARKYESFDLLNTIYNLQIEFAESEYADVLDEIIEKRNENKQLSDEDERARIANSLIKQKLKEFRLQGKLVTFEATIQDILEKYQLTEAVSKRPRLLYNLMFIARSAVLAKKDFYSFEPYVKGMYEQMEISGGFSQQHHAYKLRLLYMIAHVTYRNKKFAASVDYLESMHEAMIEYNRSYFDRFYPRYVLLLAANYVFLNKTQEGADLIEEMIANKKAKIEIQHLLNARLALCFIYYLRGEYPKAIDSARQVNHSDKWIEKKMGKEWVLKKNLSELILQYELENFDLVKNKIRAIERYHKALLSQPEYHKVGRYLQLVKIMIKNPKIIGKEAFNEQVHESFDFRAMEQEDLHDVNFYAWMKSKIIKQKYHEVLKELAFRKDEAVA